jgi:hypothetical protein
MGTRSDCTNTNMTVCSAVSNATSGTVIRIFTKGKRSIRYGKVEQICHVMESWESRLPFLESWKPSFLFQANLSPLGMQLPRRALARE